MPECKSIICEVPSDTAIYSLSTNLSFNGTPISVVVPCPAGFTCDPPITVTYPPGTFVVPDPPPVSDPCSPRPPFRVQGCLSEIIVPIPLCSTAAQIAALAQTVIQQMALQQAQCDTYPPTQPPPPIIVTNQAIAVGCENPRLQLSVTSLPSIPGITFSGGFLRAAAGIFGGTTAAIADASATAFLVGLRETLIDAGNAFCFCLANLVATPSGFSIALTWTAHPLAISYQILRGTVSGGPYEELGIVTTNSYTDEFLQGDTQYYYVVQPMIEGAFLCDSAEVPGMIVCLGAAPATAINADDITITWLAHVDAVSYKVERSLTSGGPYTTLANDGDLSYVDTTAVQGITYYYLITPIALFNVPICRSREVSAMRPCVYNLAANAGLTSITVSWTAHPDATSYAVERSTVSGGPYTTLISTALTSYEDAAVVEETTYYYRVTPYMGAASLCVSPEVSAIIGANCVCWPLEGTIINAGDSGGQAWATYDSVNNRVFVLFGGTANRLVAIDPDQTVANDPILATRTPVFVDPLNFVNVDGPAGLIAANGQIYISNTYYDSDIGNDRIIRITRINPLTLAITGSWTTGGYFEFGQSALGDMVYSSATNSLYFSGPALAGNGGSIFAFSLNTFTFTEFDALDFSTAIHGIRVEYDPVNSLIYAVKIFTGVPSIEITGFSAATFTQSTNLVLVGAWDPGLGGTGFYSRLYLSDGKLYHSGYTTGATNAVSVIVANAVQRVISVEPGATTFKADCGIMCISTVVGLSDADTQLLLTNDSVLCAPINASNSNSIVAVTASGRIYMPKPDTGGLLIYKSPGVP